MVVKQVLKQFPVMGVLILRISTSTSAASQTDDYAGLLSQDEQVRRKSVEEASPGPEAIPLLVAAACDESRVVRDAAVASLVSRGRAAAVKYLAFLAAREGAARVAFNDIGLLLLDYECPEQRVRPTDLSGHMVHTLPDSHRLAGAGWAVWAAAFPDDLQEIFEVLSGVLEDPNEQVEDMAGVALALLGWSTVSGDTPATCEDLPGVLRLMRSESPIERRAAYCLAGMLRLNDPEVVAQLKGERELTFAASITLAQIEGGCPLAFPPERSQAQTQATLKTLDELQRALADSEPMERRMQRHEQVRGLLEELPQSAENDAVPILTRLLSAKDGDIVVDAAARLFSFSPRYSMTVVGPVARVLERDSPRSMRGLQLLGRVGSAATAVIPQLIDVLAWSAEERPRNPRLLAEASARQGPCFLLALRSKRKSIEILGALGSSARAAREQLEELLDPHEDWLVRIRAARALRLMR